MSKELPIYLAPLQSYTTVFYRNAFASVIGGVDKYFTPFFEEGKNDVILPSTSLELDKSLNLGLDVVPQVATNNAEFLIRFATIAIELGYTEINLNMGCPFPMLVKRQKGGGMLGNVHISNEILKAFFKAALPIQLSVKMRSGIMDTQEGLDMIQVLNDYPLSEMIIHPRLVSQKYMGEPDWDAFAKMARTCQHRIIANGDINTLEELSQIKAEFQNLKGVMMGRGILTNPLVLMPDLNNEERLALFKKFHAYFKDELIKHCLDWNQCFSHLCNFWYYPLSGSIIGKRHLRKLKKHNSINKYELWLAEVWSLLFSH